MSLPITFDPMLPLDVHQVLDALGYDMPEAFAFPDIFVDGMTEQQRLQWAFALREILKLPLEGAYRDIAVEMARQLEMVRLFRERMRVLTAPK